MPSLRIRCKPCYSRVGNSIKFSKPGGWWEKKQTAWPDGATHTARQTPVLVLTVVPLSSPRLPLPCPRYRFLALPPPGILTLERLREGTDSVRWQTTASAWHQSRSGLVFTTVDQSRVDGGCMLGGCGLVASPCRRHGDVDEVKPGPFSSLPLAVSPTLSPPLSPQHFGCLARNGLQVVLQPYTRVKEGLVEA